MLLLDFGNSAIKGQWWLKDNLQSSFSCRLDGHWQNQLKSVLPNIESTVSATRCYFASVVDSDTEAQLINCLKVATGIEHYVRLTSQKKAAGVLNGYTDPSKLGVDRWLALLGAMDFSDSDDKLIIDAGSAITLDLLSKEGKHLGGAILPGFNTSIGRFKQVMNQVDFDHPDIDQTDDPGASTEACIHINSASPIALTNVAMVDQLIARWFKRLSPGAVMLVAGGDAQQINSHRLHLRYEIPDLVFRGMRKQLDSQP
jgi:type III pantothenate kinase